VELGERKKEKENDRATVIFNTIRCEGRGYKDMNWFLKQNPK
jgi:hypothetical protein